MTAAIPPIASAFIAVPAPTRITPELVVTAQDEIAAIPVAAPVNDRLSPTELSAQDNGTNKSGIFPSSIVALGFTK